MRFEWDEEKDAGNLRKHGLSFELAKEVFDDRLHLSVPDRACHGEERWKTIGALRETTVVVVVHRDRSTEEEEVVRIISARKATRSERRRYEQDTNP